MQTLKPRDGLKVRKPSGPLLDPEGEPVLMDTYWRRRLRDGDVEIVPPATSKKTKEPKA